MEQSTTGHDAVDDGTLSVHRWRVSQLARLGIPGTLAEMYADRIDWHQVVIRQRHGTRLRCFPP